MKPKKLRQMCISVSQKSSRYKTLDIRFELWKIYELLLGILICCVKKGGMACSPILIRKHIEVKTAW